MRKKIAIVALLVTCYLSPVTAFAQQTHTVQMTKYGFTPQKLEVTKGNIIKFVNNDANKHTLEGKNFILNQIVLPGESFEFNAIDAGLWNYQDKLAPTHEGQIIIDETSFRIPQPESVTQKKISQENNGFLYNLVGFFNKLIHSIKDLIIGAK